MYSDTNTKDKYPPFCRLISAIFYVFKLILKKISSGVLPNISRIRICVYISCFSSFEIFVFGFLVFSRGLVIHCTAESGYDPIPMMIYHTVFFTCINRPLITAFINNFICHVEVICSCQQYLSLLDSMNSSVFIYKSTFPSFNFTGRLTGINASHFNGHRVFCRCPVGGIKCSSSNGLFVAKIIDEFCLRTN